MERVTNIFARPEKISMRNRLFQIAEEALEKDGWRVEPIARSGKPSVRRITKGKLQKTVTIRTSQDTWIAFPRTQKDNAWATLADVDCVVVASVNDRVNPQFAQVHFVPGDEVRERFDRAYAARKKAGHTVPVGRGVWLSLYEKESTNPVSLVGGGIALAHPPIAKVPLSGQVVDTLSEKQDSEPVETVGAEAPLTIAEAKRRLAMSLGVTESDIKITITS